jgi:1,4-dihydroxy-2-naphthoate octaprenyltransferase
MNSNPPPPPTAGIGLWMRTARAPFLAASAMPALLGVFAAHSHTGALAVDRFVLTLLGVVCVHLGANVANDYYDHLTGADPMNLQPTPFSGGSRVIQDGLVSPGAALVLAILLLAVGLTVGIILNAMIPGNTVILLAAAGILCGFVYTATPIKLSYRGLGEMVIFTAFGPLTVMGAYLCQTGDLDTFAFHVSIPAGLLVLAILLVNEVLDFEWDQKAGKRTLVVMLGKERAYGLFLAVYLSAFASVAALMVSGRASPYAALAFIPPALALRGLVPANALSTRAALTNASRLTILTQVAATGVLAVSYLVWS